MAKKVDKSKRAKKPSKESFTRRVTREVVAHMMKKQPEGVENDSRDPVYYEETPRDEPFPEYFEVLLPGPRCFAPGT